MKSVTYWRALAGIVLSSAVHIGIAEETQWPLFGRDAGGSQYSPLEQINRGNVDQLEVAWVHKSGDIVKSKDKRNSTTYEVSPIHANNLLYYCTPLNRVFALNPETGEERWMFDPHSPETEGGKPLIEQDRSSAFCRGVSYWQADNAEPGVDCQKRIFRPDNHGHIFAIDADTGESCRDFGAEKGHPGYVSNWDYPVNGGDPFRGLTSPPAIVGDLVIAGSGAIDSNANANDGVVRAWNAYSGRLEWEFNPIPQGKRDITGAGNVWGTISVDLERQLVFLPTTSASPDFFGGTRSFELPLTSAVVALDANSGDVVWSFQTVRHDLWDYDLAPAPLLVTVEKDGKRVDAAVLHTKMGWVYVFDRATGESLWPIREKAVPASDNPNEQAAATQPVPEGIAAFADQELKREDIWGFTPLDRYFCRKDFDGYRSEGIYTPPSERGTVVIPSQFGGGNWGGGAFDKSSNTLIVKAQNLATIMKVRIPEKPLEPEEITFGKRPLNGTPYIFEGTPFLSFLGVPCNPPPWGTLTALDIGTGKIKWQRPLGQVKKWGVTVPDFLGWGSPNVGGPIVTAGGLIFIAATMDSKFRAFDVDSGEELWSAKLPAPGTAVPMTYSVKGHQYVVIAAGGAAWAGPDIDDAIVAFALKK